MKNFAGILGLVLIVGTIAGGNVKYITDWSSGELIGFNIWTIVAFAGGGYLVYWSLKSRKGV